MFHLHVHNLYTVKYMYMYEVTYTSVCREKFVSLLQAFVKVLGRQSCEATHEPGFEAFVNHFMRHTCSIMVLGLCKNLRSSSVEEYSSTCIQYHYRFFRHMYVNSASRCWKIHVRNTIKGLQIVSP